MMDGIRGNDYDALKFTGAAIWRIYTWGGFGGAPEMPISTLRNPHFGYLWTQLEHQLPETHHFVGVIQKIGHASLIEDFSG